VLDVLVTLLRQSGDAKKSDQGPRSLVALVAPGKGGFLELLHGDQGPESRKLWLSVILVREREDSACGGRERRQRKRVVDRSFIH